jgi:exodeoxyribonuclease-3
MKICTYNVNSIRARRDLVLQWLDHRGGDIDILCLQELKAEDEFFPLPDFAQMGYSCAVSGQKAYNGVAICSRPPLEDIRKGFGDAAWDEQKRAIAARVSGLTLYNLYVPHGGERGGDKHVFKLEWYRQLISRLEQDHSPDDPLLLVGDFNVAHTDDDVYSAEALFDTIGTMPEEREAFSRLLDWGLRDVYRERHPDEKQFTWWGYMGGAIWKDEGMRIDYALATPPLLERIEGIEVDLWPRKRRSPTPSDHAPLIVTLDAS